MARAPTRVFPGGVVQARKARQNGALVLVVNGDQYGVDTDGGEAPWSTICEDHGWIVSHRSLATAKSHAPVPTEWCEPCAAVAAGKCPDCGEKPGPRPAAKYDEKQQLPGTCNFCHAYFGAPKGDSE